MGDFSYRRAEEIFKQFFGGRDPFAELFDEAFDLGGKRSGRRKIEKHRRAEKDDFFSTFTGLPLNAGFQFSSFENILSDSGFASFGPGIPKFKTVTTTTKLVNGKKVTTRRTVENGQEKVEVEDNGKLRSIHINGREQKSRLEYK
uniref:Uncharacterized protein n=1 Tax=Eptatretus burgeri TaxID=7764 RepID=A0A8C4Q3B4_EPTBU